VYKWQDDVAKLLCMYCLCKLLIVSCSTNVDNADAVAADVTTTIMSQRLELEDKNKSIIMLQKALVSCVGVLFLCYAVCMKDTWSI